MPKSEKLEFQTEVSQLLKLMINSVYSEKEVFVRELVSNASDACDKLRYLSNTKVKLIKDDPNFKIQITINKKNNLITISDNGIGMNKKDALNRFLYPNNKKTKLEVSSGEPTLCAVVIETNTNGLSKSINPLRLGGRLEQIYLKT